MKRCFEEDEPEAVYSETVARYETHASNCRNVEKRSRSGSPPMVVGPLIFNGEGTELQQNLFEAQVSSLPGVHRLAASESSRVRLWAPQWPLQQFLETSLPRVLQAIDGKCIFIFDTRATADDVMLGNTSTIESLLSNPTIRRFGMLVSRFEPQLVLGPAHPAIPYIQDPIGSLAILCNFYEYLGPSAVCVKNGEVMATTMLSRSPEALTRTLNEWYDL